MRQLIIFVLGLFFSCFVYGQYKTYTIEKGDTLSGISKKHYGSADRWKKLHSHNPQIKNPHLIYPGHALSLYKNGFYLSGGLGYYRNMASGDKSELMIQPAPSTPYYPVFYDNSAHGQGMGLYVGGGYQWWLSRQWSWSLGGRLSYEGLEQKGDYTLSGAITSYRYDINALLLNLVLRVYWHFSLRNAFYGEATTGLSHLSSENFRLTDTNSSAEHVTKRKANVDYGLSLGWLYAFDRHTSLEIALGYVNLGKAELGTRIVPSGATSKGEVTQKVRGLTARMGLVYWF